MTQPQQPELRRSGRGRTTQDGKRIADETDRAERKRGRRGRAPEENRPGHRPEHEQDKPEGTPDEER